MENKVLIVTPNNANKQEKFACDELVFFLARVQDCETEVVLEKDFNKNSQNYIVLGNVAFNQANVEDLINVVGEDGYRIVTTKTAAYICGGAGQGTIFGVYRFLKEYFNLVIYTEDVFTFDKKPLKFYTWVNQEKPDLPMRALGIYPVHLERRYPGEGNKRYCYRMRLRQMDEGWGINNHTYFRILPPAIYKEAHPEWYDPAVKNLCLSNEEMTAEYIKNMKKIIEDTPNERYYMFGTEDVRVYCQCPKCKALMDKFGGFTGLTIYFANKCIKELNAWLEKEYPERAGKVIFFTFAYSKCIAPPVIKQADGSYKLISEELKPAENSGILIAPYHVCQNYPLTDPRSYHCLTPKFHGKERMRSTELFDRWLSVYKYFATWTYNAQFVDYMVPCPMWKSIPGNFKYFKELGALHCFFEAGCGQNLNFAAMKIFCASNLMWDTSLDMDKLIEQFMDVYFGEAKHELRAYFDYIHKHADWLDKYVNRQMIHVHFDDEPNKRYLDERFWPIGVLKECIEFFDRALECNLTEEQILRVRLESISAKFSMLYLYYNRIDKDYALALMDDILEISEKTGMKHATQVDEEYIDKFVERWKKELSEAK